MNPIVSRSTDFARRYDLPLPILMAPMAGACPPELAHAVVQGGGMGACGALLETPAGIGQWVARFEALGGGPLLINLWVPDPEPVRDAAHEAAVRDFLAQFAPRSPDDAIARLSLQSFDDQFEAIVAARPAVFSTIMGLPGDEQVARLKAAGIAWFATVTTLADALAAEAAGADAVVVQGAEAGGHRGAFDPARAVDEAVGLFALLPIVCDAVRVPVVASGGIADARGVAAALVLGASAVQIGTGLLRTPEAGIAPGWARGIAAARPESTRISRAVSGRPGRSLATDYVARAASADAPSPLPYPLQRALTANLRKQALLEDDLQRMQAWCGQAAALARDRPAASLVADTWAQARALLPAA
ncbi:MAG: nitronate monooxygenase [Burkholderiaceae bacterium]